MKLKYDKLLSNVAFRFNLGRYNEAERRSHKAMIDLPYNDSVGWCRLTLSNPR